MVGGAGYVWGGVLGAALVVVLKEVLQSYLPLILPGIAAAALLSFALSIDDYIITSFVAGDHTTTFPMRIFNANKTEIPPQVNVIATMILVFTGTLMALGARRAVKQAKL